MKQTNKSVEIQMESMFWQFEWTEVINVSPRNSTRLNCTDELWIYTVLFLSVDFNIGGSRRIGATITLIIYYSCFDLIWLDQVLWIKSASHAIVSTGQTQIHIDFDLFCLSCKSIFGAISGVARKLWLYADCVEFRCILNRCFVSVYVVCVCDCGI